MKIQIDTNTKILKLEENTNLGDFVTALAKLFPDEEWKEYTLETNTIINNWVNPIIIDRWRYDYYPWITTPLFIGDTLAGNSEDNINLGIYNVAI